jgi:hypothetical protein
MEVTLKQSSEKKKLNWGCTSDIWRTWLLQVGSLISDILPQFTSACLQVLMIFFARSWTNYMILNVIQLRNRFDVIVSLFSFVMPSCLLSMGSTRKMNLGLHLQSCRSSNELTQQSTYVKTCCCLTALWTSKQTFNEHVAWSTDMSRIKNGGRALKGKKKKAHHRARRNHNRDFHSKKWSYDSLLQLYRLRRIHGSSCVNNVVYSDPSLSTSIYIYPNLTIAAVGPAAASRLCTRRLMVKQPKQANKWCFCPQKLEFSNHAMPKRKVFSCSRWI